VRTRTPRHAAALALVCVLTLLWACSEGTAQFEAERRETLSVAWLERRPDLVICRLDNDDLGYSDVLVTKIPTRDQQSDEHLTCHDLLSGRLRTNTREIAGNPDYGLKQWPHAAQWMHLRADVHECVLQSGPVFDSSDKYDSVKNVSPSLTVSPLTSVAGPQMVSPGLFRNCGSQLIYVSHAEVASGTPACDGADVPACGTESP
jgi:hypothetical protein